MSAQKSLTYDDVTLVPRFFSYHSRSELDTSIVFGGKQFNLPIIPANMKCVIDEEVSERIQQHDYLYVMHRFGIDNYNFVLHANKSNIWKTISISVGVKQEDYDALTKIYKDSLRVDFITVDIAHGHCSAMQLMLSFLSKHFPNTTIIAGNVGSKEGALDLILWGANAIKVGIGPGKSCTTRLKTGFYTPMFSTIQNIRNSLQDTSCVIIADGGINYNGDIAKAIVAGADLVMAGSLFAQCIDSPGQIIDGKKLFYGSASAENKGTNKNVEGKKLLLDSNGLTYLDKLTEIKEDLQSSISYAGGKCVADLKNTQYIIV